MYATSWVPGTNRDLDNLFDQLRQQRFLDTDHKLHKNFDKKQFENVSILTISFDNDNNPKFCGSVIAKNCWPKKVYRIVNRIWKIDLQPSPLQKLSEGGKVMMSSQIKWLRENTDCELYFISRSGNYWQQFVVDECKNRYNLTFEFDNYKYQTCTTPNDDSCWQKIIYCGNANLLQNWSRK
jgi:hypothetical protein